MPSFIISNAAEQILTSMVLTTPKLRGASVTASRVNSRSDPEWDTNYVLKIKRTTEIHILMRHSATHT